MGLNDRFFGFHRRITIKSIRFSNHLSKAEKYVLILLEIILFEYK